MLLPAPDRKCYIFGLVRQKKEKKKMVCAPQKKIKNASDRMLLASIYLRHSLLLLPRCVICSSLEDRLNIKYSLPSYFFYAPVQLPSNLRERRPLQSRIRFPPMLRLQQLLFLPSDSFCCIAYFSRSAHNYNKTLLSLYCSYARSR